ncbi:hypothetical protein BKA69DRAFT_836591 [Paraphysoderma sedebokerense]|nr:hypothetical protein BKA69DRAFT_836591 [Paraphysoderma sedebokerense]
MNLNQSDQRIRPLSSTASITSDTSTITIHTDVNEYDLEKITKTVDSKRRRRRFIICGFLSVFGLIMGLITYFVIIPAMIRNGIANNPFYIYPDNVTAALTGSKSINFNFSGELFLSGLPVNSKIDAGAFTLRTTLGDPLVELKFPMLDTFTSSRSKLDYAGSIEIINVEKMAQLLKGISEDGTTDELTELVATSTLGIAAFGVKWYPSLTVERRFPLKDITISRILDSLLTGQELPGLLGSKMPADPTLEKNPRPQFPAIELLINALTRISFMEQGITVNTDVGFKNVIPLGFTIPTSSLVVKLQDLAVIKGRVRNLGLKPSSQMEKLAPSFDVLFLSDIPEVVKRAEIAFQQFKATGNLGLSISGPIEWPGPVELRDGKDVPGSYSPGAEPASWLSEMTKYFKIDIPVLQLITYALSRGTDIQRIVNSTSINTASRFESGLTVISVNLTMQNVGILPSLALQYRFGAAIAIAGADVLDIGVRYVHII